MFIRNKKQNEWDSSISSPMRFFNEIRQSLEISFINVIGLQCGIILMVSVIIANTVKNDDVCKMTRFNSNYMLQTMFTVFQTSGIAPLQDTGSAQSITCGYRNSQ